MSEQKFVELVRYFPQYLYVVGPDEKVKPLSIFKPKILRIDPNASKELKRKMIEGLVSSYEGANAFEIGDAKTVSSENGHCERDYAIGVYTIPEDALQRALNDSSRLEKELSPGRF